MFAVLSFILRLIGLGNWLDKLITKHQDEKKAQEVADAPQTVKEEADYFK